MYLILFPKEVLCHISCGLSQAFTWIVSCKLRDILYLCKNAQVMAFIMMIIPTSDGRPTRAGKDFAARHSLAIAKFQVYSADGCVFGHA